MPYLLLSFALLGNAVSEPHVIRGFVHDPDGNPISDASVFLASYQDCTPRRARSGPDGEFTIADLEPFATRYSLDVGAMREVLEGRDYIETVAADQAAARAIGAGGVPFFVFNDRIGLSGAQPVAAFRQALEQAAG